MCLLEDYVMHHFFCIVNYSTISAHQLLSIILNILVCKAYNIVSMP